MSYYAIGIGGTGAKCIESLIHASAAGLIPRQDDLNLLFIDPDGANGSLGRATSLLNNYRTCRRGRVDGQNLFKTRVEPLVPDNSDENTPFTWTPLGPGKTQLDAFFSSNLLSDEAKHLFNLLFTPEEQTTNLDVGFRGRPAIGAAVMANAVDLERSEPWLSIKKKMEAEVGDGQPVKIILFGSIFGGTGASGFPTIGKIFREWVNGFKGDATNSVDLAGVLLLPYFSFPPVEGQGVAANSDDFLLNTQAALQYYANRNNLGVFDRTYVVGSEERQRMRQPQIGGRLQENDPHFVELYAAVAATSFFAEDVIEGEQFLFAGRESSKQLRWNDIPNGVEVQKGLVHMARFCYSFVHVYHPMISDIVSHGSAYRAPWFVNYFHFKGVPVRDELSGRLDELRKYCLSYLLWLAKIELSVEGKLTSNANLLNISTFTSVDEKSRNGVLNLRGSFDHDGLLDMHLPGEARVRKPVEIWDSLCNSRSKGNSVSGTWYFLNDLFDRCGNGKSN